MQGRIKTITMMSPAVLKQIKHSKAD